MRRPRRTANFPYEIPVSKVTVQLEWFCEAQKLEAQLDTLRDYLVQSRKEDLELFDKPSENLILLITQALAKLKKDETRSEGLDTVQNVAVNPFLCCQGILTLLTEKCNYPHICGEEEEGG
jgi:hypothetical protein